MNVKTIALAGMALCIAAPALAHHSFAMFDREKTVTMSGHREGVRMDQSACLDSPDGGGRARQAPWEWSFEMQAIAQDMAGGWRPDSVKPGDKVSIEYHPLKDGSRGGQLVAATLADGKRLGGPVRRPGAQD